MNKFFRIFLSLVVIIGLCLGSFLTYSSGQNTNDFSDFFEGKQNEESIATQPEKESSGILDFFLKPESKSKNIQEIEIAPRSENTLHTKEMVEVPASSPRLKSMLLISKILFIESEDSREIQRKFCNLAQHWMEFNFKRMETPISLLNNFIKNQIFHSKMCMGK